MQCLQNGHEIACFANLRPSAGIDTDLDSYMYQTVGFEAVELIAKACGIPLFRREIKGIFD